MVRSSLVRYFETMTHVVGLLSENYPQDPLEEILFPEVFHIKATRAFDISKNKNQPTFCENTLPGRNSLCMVITM